MGYLFKVWSLKRDKKCLIIINETEENVLETLILKGKYWLGIQIRTSDGGYASVCPKFVVNILQYREVLVIQKRLNG